MNIPRRIDLVISDQSYVLEVLRVYRDIVDSGCCNDCRSKKDCEYAPEWGQLVRYNCPFYKRKEETMARAWKCDICGDYYDPNGAVNTEYLERGYMDQNDIKTQSRIEVFHMCPKCSLAIDNAIDKRRKNNDN